MNPTFRTLLAGVAWTALAGALPAHAEEERCTFTSSDAHMTARLGTSDGGPLEFTWVRSSGTIQSVSWTPRSGRIWIAYPGSPGRVDPIDSRFDIGFTAAGDDATRYAARGRLHVDLATSGTTFAAIWEGSNPVWFVAYGTAKCAVTRSP